VLATGAIERFLPFPGWTLPGVFGAGALQALHKSGLPLAGRRILVAGSGPLLLAVAKAFRDAGGHVPAIVEQTPRKAVLRFAAQLPRHPKKLLQALGLGLSLLPVRQLYSAWPLRAEGRDKLERVVVERAGREEAIACDFLACGFGLSPSLPLARLLGCEVEKGCVKVDELLQTSVGGLYAAGESLGIGGVSRAQIDGRIAGLAAAGAALEAARLLPRRRAEESFARALAKAYELREELRNLVDKNTVVCRCEDVRWGEIRPSPSARDAKLKTRAGMGPCQGRVCGSALEFLTGFAADAVRPPLFPVSCETLAELYRLAAELEPSNTPANEG
jgi:NADPH-dependent 2,4-dienoyl-CoA reductase/sulfur reductase-like enzyme